MTAPSITVRCPAKVNLSLRVLRRRPDGYHDLDVVFQAIDLWDTLEVRPDSELRLTCSDSSLPTDESNLVIRAAALLRGRLGRGDEGARLHLDKTIPVEGGLGGGSSNAAGTLLACSRIWGLQPTDLDLQEMARELGADVPFFLTGGTAKGAERGDLITKLDDLGPVPILLGVPPFGMSTAEVFQACSARLTLPQNGVSLRLVSPHKWLTENDFGSMVNDLEGVVFDQWPTLKQFRDGLIEEGALGALLSGSGSTVYGIFRDHHTMRNADRELRARFTNWKVLPTRAVKTGTHFLVADDGRGGR